MREDAILSTGQDIEVRRYLSKWLASTKPVDVESQVVDGPSAAKIPCDRIWTYWEPSQETSIPRVVVAAISSQQDFYKDRHMYLDANTIPDYISIRLFPHAMRASTTTTHYTDVLRLALLWRFGGIWMDATVFLSDKLERDVEEANVFFYQRPQDPFLLSSWLIKSDRKHPLIEAWFEALLRYWRDHTSLIHYFTLHFLFECIYNESFNVRVAVAKMPYRSFQPPHAMQGLLHTGFDARKLADSLNNSRVHKLTYKATESSTGHGLIDVIDGAWLSNVRRLRLM